MACDHPSADPPLGDEYRLTRGYFNGAFAKRLLFDGTLIDRQRRLQSTLSATRSAIFSSSTFAEESFPM